MSDDDRPGAGTVISDRQLAAVMRDAPIGMMIIDHDDQLLEANRAMCELTGRSEAVLAGMSWRDFTHPDDRDIGAVEIAELFAGQRESFTVEKRYVRPDGAVRWALTSVSLIRDALGEPQYRITQHVDITDRKRWEADLRETAAMQAQAIEELRRLEDAKSMFLTAVSHELRTPLTVIHGLAETLARPGQVTADDVRRRLEGALVANTRRMTALIDDLLNLDRLTSGGLALEPTRLNIVEHVERLVSDSPLHGRTALDAPARLEVTTDPDRVALIVNNLLGNVIKYAPEGPVSVTLRPVADGGFRLEVQDHGPGIPPGQRELVFQPFHRIASDHPNPGTGIGLSLVARLASMHGGDAAIVDSDMGTHVVVTLPDLPLTDGPHQPAHATVTEPEPEPPKADDRIVAPLGDARADAAVTGRILVVDDDPQVRAMFRAALIYAGHDVTEAGDAHSAHAVLAQQTFDLALLDMDLSDSSGAGIASLIRADVRHAGMGVVFVSGDTSTETKLAGLRAGGSDYLTKPVSLRELLGRVDAHLRDRLLWTDRLQQSLRERSHLAEQVLELQGLVDLPALSARLRALLQASFEVHGLTVSADRAATFAVTVDADRARIRLPLTIGVGQIGALDLTTSTQHSQRATTILSDLGPHIATISAGALRRDVDARRRRDR